MSFVVTFLFFLILGPGTASLALKLRGFSENMNVITEGVTRVDEVLNENHCLNRCRENFQQVMYQVP